MRADRRTTTLADVRVGASAVLVAGSALDARRARRLRELGLRPGATVRVMMRTAGGGRVLGVDNLRIVVDRQTLDALPAILTPVAATPVAATPVAATPVAATPVAATPVATGGRRLRLLGRLPGLTALPAEPIGDGTD